ncbi:hypothetical protein OG21DRAFT_1135032 [Imleria badia]|nr:hypothetical protein OG21DRAFT_1135032 [Imleria badia]
MIILSSYRSATCDLRGIERSKTYVFPPDKLCPFRKLKTKSRTSDTIVQKTILSPLGHARLTKWPQLEQLLVGMKSHMQSPVVTMNVYCMFNENSDLRRHISSLGSMTSSTGTSRCKFSNGNAVATASAAIPERTAKKEKRIVIELLRNKKAGGRIYTLLGGRTPQYD